MNPILTTALNTIFPPQCLSCKELIEVSGNLCSDCWENINFISSPQCSICGYPFEIKADNDVICGKCITKPPKYTKARAVFSYSETSSKLITDFKYGDKTHASDHFAKWLIRAGREFINDSDIIAPVPLHKIRLFSRRYNQSALLTNSIGHLCEKQICNDLLIRCKNTPPQAGLTYNQRIKNVRTAFKLNPKYQEQINSKNIILVDDVMTTGSTIDACTRTLLKAGAGEVNVLTLAITVKN